MEPEEYERLRRIARERKVSVAELIRTALRDAFLSSPTKPKAALEEILALRLPVLSWEEIEDEVSRGHGDPLP